MSNSINTSLISSKQELADTLKSLADLKNGICKINNKDFFKISSIITDRSHGYSAEYPTNNFYDFDGNLIFNTNFLCCDTPHDIKKAQDNIGLQFKGYVYSFIRKNNIREHVFTQFAFDLNDINTCLNQHGNWLNSTNYKQEILYLTLYLTSHPDLKDCDSNSH